MECIHTTLTKPSYIINVIPGNWTRQSKAKQVLVNFHTYFEVFSLCYQNSKISFESIYQQEFFSKVHWIDAGPEVSGLTSFFEITKTKVIQLVYSEESGLFAAVRTINVPDICHNPCYVKFLRTSLIVSCANGSICSFSLPNYEVSFAQKTSNIVFQCIEWGSDSIIRVEDGSLNFVQYGRSPFERIPYFSYSGKSTMIFPYENDQIVICEENNLIIRKDESFFSLSLSEVNAEIDPGYVISHAKVNISLHIILTSNGHLFKLDSNYELSFIESFENAKNVFFVAFDFIIISFHCDQTIIYDFVNKTTIHSLNGFYGDQQIQELVPGEFISFGFEKLLIRKFGIEYVEKLQVELDIDEDITNIIHFELGKLTYFMIITKNRSIIFDEEFNQANPVDYIENVETKDIKVFKLKGNKYILIQLTKNKVYKNGILMDDKTHFGDIICSSSTKSYMVVYWSNYYQSFISLTKDESNVKMITETESYHPVACAFPPGKRGLFVFVDDKNHLIAKDDLVIFDIELPSRVNSIVFMDDKTLIIGFENGYVTIGNFAQNYKGFESSKFLKIGEKPVLLKSFENVCYLISNNIWIVSNNEENMMIRPLQRNDFVILCPFISKNEFIAVQENSINIFEWNNFARFSLLEFKLPNKLISNLCVIPNTGFLFFNNNAFIYYFDRIREKLKKVFSAQENERIRIVQFDKKNSLLYFSVTSKTESKLYIIQVKANLAFKVVKTYVNELPVGTYHYGIVEDGFIYEENNHIVYFRIDGEKANLVSKIPSKKLKIKNCIKSDNFSFFSGKNQCLYRMKFINDNKIQLISNTSPRLITVGTEFGNSAAYGDRNGNVVIFSDSNLRYSTLVSKFEMCIGSVITGIASKDVTNRICMYSTANGALGAVMMINNEKILMEANLLKRIEKLTLMLFTSITGSDYLTYRNGLSPCQNYLDLDLVSIFFKIKETEQKKICQTISMNITPEVVKEYYDDISMFFEYLAI